MHCSSILLYDAYVHIWNRVLYDTYVLQLKGSAVNTQRGGGGGGGGGQNISWEQLNLLTAMHSCQDVSLHFECEGDAPVMDLKEPWYIVAAYMLSSWQ